MGGSRNNTNVVKMRLYLPTYAELADTSGSAHNMPIKKSIAISVKKRFNPKVICSKPTCIILENFNKPGVSMFFNCLIG